MPEIKRGSSLIYRVFDVAEEIDLARAERILVDQKRETLFRITAGNSPSVTIRNAPVRVHLGDIRIDGLPALSGPISAAATIWDYGVVSIAFEMPLRDISWLDLAATAGKLTYDPAHTDAIDRAALAEARRISEAILPAIKEPEISPIVEDYIIHFIQSFGQTITDPIRELDLPSVILGEPKETLSDRARDGILQHFYQYSKKDFVVIDWNSAVVHEPSGAREILDVLEFAVTHLLELRYYDDLIDKKLAQLYDSIEVKRKGSTIRHSSAAAREANALFIEFSEFIERIDNSLKVVGDFYLATLFRGAAKRYRISDWQESITRKMNILARVSELLQGEANTRRSHALELVIIGLIAFEIVSAMLKAPWN